MAEIVPFPNSLTSPPDGRSAPDLKSIRVLLVEDDEVDAKLFKWAARRIGMDEDRIDWCQRIEQAHTKLATGTYDLHVFDYWIGPDPSSCLIDRALQLETGGPVLVLSNLSPEELMSVYRQSSRLRVLCKGHLAVDGLRDAIEQLAWGLSRLEPVGSAGWSPDMLLAAVRDARNLANRIEGAVTIADTHLSGGDIEAGHSYVAGMAGHVDALKAKLDTLEKLVHMRSTEKA